MYLRWTATVLYLPPWSKHWARYGAPPSWEDSSCLHSPCWPYKKKALRTFTSSKNPQRKKPRQPPTLSTLQSLESNVSLWMVCHLVSYDPSAERTGSQKSPEDLRPFPKADGLTESKEGKKKKMKAGRQQRSGRATHSGLCMSNKFISLDTNSNGEHWLKIIMEENTRIQITRCRQAVIALWWQGPIESRI